MTKDYRSENESMFIHTKEYIKWQCFFLPPDAQLDSFKNNFKFALNFTLKSSYMFRHKTHPQEAHYLRLAKVTIVKMS